MATESLDVLLRRHGLHVTAQRLAVLRAISERPHSTADDIHALVGTDIGAISRQAVYDALTTLSEKGVLRRIQPAGSPARYENRVGDNHHHLICRTCSRMVDVDPPMMLTTDLALKLDPTYGPITRRFRENPDQLADAFARAWYKLIHRDMGPVTRLHGPWVAPPQLWQDPVPEVDHELIDGQDIAGLKSTILGSGLSVSQLVSAAWASASSFRGTDKRGGANGARIRLAPQRDWEVNDPTELGKVLQRLEEIQQEFNGSASGGKKVSLADLIVLGGCAAVEQAAKNAGYDVTVPFTPGRTDASQDQTDVESFTVLEPRVDPFRNYVRPGEKMPLEHLMVERAFLLNLTAPEMTALVGGMRALNANTGGTAHGVFTDRPETLTNDFFVNVLDMGTEWKTSEMQEHVYEGRDRGTGEVKWTATTFDLVFGSHAQLRALSLLYAQEDSKEKFVSDFVAAWDKVMNLEK